MTQSSRGAKRRFCFEPGYVLQVGPTSSLNLFQFSSFSVAVDENVNKPLRLESVTSAVPRITREDSPGLPPPFLHTGSDQKLEVWKAGNEAKLRALVTNLCPE